VRGQRTAPRGARKTRLSQDHPSLCIPRLLVMRSAQTPDAPALLAPGRPPLTYRQLQDSVEDTVQTLQAQGLRPHDRVAVVLPHGPEMAVACLAVASGAICMPLNPAYTTSEFDLYLGKQRPRALMIQAGLDSPAHAVAQAHGLQIIELQPRRVAASGLLNAWCEIP
jgi:acyl-CoA synthetase (AMP-forming)/AMP-acid ligase II